MNPQALQIGPYRIRVVNYTDRLYRADTHKSLPDSRADIEYRGAAMKYFATQKAETASYTKRGPYVKTWVPTRPLVLVDMFDRYTRDVIRTLLQENTNAQAALNVAFPLNAIGRVYRYSETDTAHLDDIVLGALCNLGVVDGYFVPATEGFRPGPEGRPGLQSFHSEVGLCKAALPYLKLEAMSMNAPPPMPTRKRKRNNNYNNNSSNKNKNKYKNSKNNNNKTRRNFRPMKFSMFGNMNTNTNMNMPAIKRFKTTLNFSE